MALSAMIRDMREQFGALLALLATLSGIATERWGKPAASKLPGSGGRLHRAAQAGTIISVVIIGVIALVGILIFASINDALPAISNNELSNASTGVTEGFANSMELIPIVMLVLVAALVIGVVQRMRGTNGGM